MHVFIDTNTVYFTTTLDYIHKLVSINVKTQHRSMCSQTRFKAISRTTETFITCRFLDLNVQRQLSQLQRLMDVCYLIGPIPLS